MIEDFGKPNFRLNGLPGTGNENQGQEDWKERARIDDLHMMACNGLHIQV
jgi:hypothetical protein